MAPASSVGFIRVKLLQCEADSPAGETFDPYVAINVKEAVNTPGENFITFVYSTLNI